jgi:hypothetical protein
VDFVQDVSISRLYALFSNPFVSIFFKSSLRFNGIIPDDRKPDNLLSFDISRRTLVVGIPGKFVVEFVCLFVFFFSTFYIA